MLLRTLGGLALSGVDFHRPKPLLLLAYLAMEGPNERHHLADLFWMGAADPRQSLSVALSQVRRASPELVGSDGVRVWARVACDARKLLEAAANRDWREVLRLYAGPFLEGLDTSGIGVELEEWTYRTRELLALHALRALVESAELDLMQGRETEAERTAERAVALLASSAEADEAVLSRLHALFLAVGSPRVRELRGEAESLGITLNHGAERAPARRSPASRTAVVSARPWSSNAAPFLGREEELRELRRLLEGGARLVTITGLGGVGKTRLASALAQQEADRGAYDRVLFVPLEAALDTSEVLPRIASALTAADGRDPKSVVEEELGRQEALVVLDNFEQLAADPGLLTDLLAACPRLRLIVTSRVPLGVGAESIYPLDGLALPPAHEAALPRVSAYGSLRLFELCARRSDPRFSLDAGNLGSALGICSLVAGVPLGLELAAALVRALPLDELLSELAADQDVLVNTRPGVPGRHASLRTVFDHSWRLLRERERAVLAGTAVFAGGFTRQAAAEVVGARTPWLAALVDNSLVRRHGGRYELHPLIRRYAADRLEERADEAEALRERHAQYFCAFLEAKAKSAGRAGQRQAYEGLDGEYANVRSAWEWAIRARRPELLERMVVGLWRFLGSRGRFGELENLLEAAAGCAPPGSMLEARLLFARGDLSTEEDPARAQALLTRALEIFRRVGGEVDAAMALLWLGTALAHQGDIEGARSLWREALPTFERLEEDTCASICLSHLSITTTQASEAELLLARAIELSRRSDIILVLAQHLVNLNVFVATTYGDYTRSLGLLEEAIQLERDELGRPYRLADLHCRAALDLINLGEFARAQRQLELATQLLAERESWEAHAQYGGAGGLWAHAWLHFARGEVEAAAAAAEESSDYPTSRELLARIALARGDRASAKRHAHGLSDLALGSLPRDALLFRATAHLLAAEAAGLAEPDAREHLQAGLRIITEYTFVPLALDALVTAQLLFPDAARLVGGTRLRPEGSDALLRLAAAHPAATLYTRQRAAALLGVPVAPPGGSGVAPGGAEVGRGDSEAGQGGPGVGPRYSGLSPDELIALAGDLRGALLNQ